MAVNHLVYQGRLVADPELRDTASGVKVVNVRIAWSKKFKDKETKCYLDCKAFSSLAEHIAKYFRKGQEILVEGELNTEEWEKDGQKRSKISLMVSSVHFCGPKQGGTGAGESVQPNLTPVEDPEGLPF